MLLPGGAPAPIIVQNTEYTEYIYLELNPRYGGPLTLNSLNTMGIKLQDKKQLSINSSHKM